MVINPSYIKASHLVRISAVLVVLGCLADYLLNGKSLVTIELVAIYIWLTILIVIAFLIRKGIQWVKWLFLVLLVIGIGPEIIAQVVAKIAIFHSSIIVECITVIQYALQITALVLLFIPYKQPEEDIIEPGTFGAINELDV